MHFLAAALTAGALLTTPPSRVVVLAFDGVDAGIVETMIAAGRLPNLAKLEERGGFSPLTPPVPPQTPVSWTSFSTGLDPGGHQIFDFLKRNPADMTPTFAVAEEKEVPFLLGRKTPPVAGAVAAALFFVPAALVARKRRRAVAAVLLVLGAAAAFGSFAAARAWLPATRPAVESNRRGVTFWSEPAAGPATVIRMPVTFPPEPFPGGRLLSGLGVPDLSGRIGKPSYYTSDPFFAPREGNDFSIELVRLESNVGRQTTRIVGPPGRAFGRDGAIELPMTLSVPDTRDRISIEAGKSKLTLEPGQWSDWTSLDFRVNPLVTVHGYARFLAESVAPEIAVYLSPIQFDPERLPPGFEISTPADWAAGLVRQFGRFKTMGWAIDTWSIQSGTLSEPAFLEDVASTVAHERKILAALLKEEDRRLLVHYFEFPDRVAHVFWRFRDPKHPAYDPELAGKYGDAVEKAYETMDEIVGETSRALPADAALMVLSDHGFATWRRSVNYDSWLVDKGYLVLKGNARRQNLEALFSRGAFWEAVDWSRSRAYAMGLGDLYVNLRGREKEGIVDPGPEYEALREEISRGLLELTDPATGERAVSRVFKREETYRRYDPRLIPDLIVSNRPGYRVSWQASLGVPTGSVFEDNRDVWSGDHCSLDPALVRGVFFASRPFSAPRTPAITDATAALRALLAGNRGEGAIVWE
ncbi:MAG TPA: alkaline phosphatase family protein [Thermoanaerobaculia bacterium]|nr:alkaline phosphatase family protein [Thermoanaerobaculia bacterium]